MRQISNTRRFAGDTTRPCAVEQRESVVIKRIDVMARIGAAGYLAERQIARGISAAVNECWVCRNEALRQAYCTREGLLKGAKIAFLTAAAYASLC